MVIGERIHFFHTMRGMTQKYLGMLPGFPEKSADVRLARYEMGTRSPKAEITAALAQALDVSPHALTVPDIDSAIGLMHTLFTLEDLYGLKITQLGSEVCLHSDKDVCASYITILFEMFSAWHKQVEKLKSGEISKEEYDN